MPTVHPLCVSSNFPSAFWKWKLSVCYVALMVCFSAVTTLSRAMMMLICRHAMLLTLRAMAGAKVRGAPMYQMMIVAV